MLFGLRYFERAINKSPDECSTKEAFSWGEVDMRSFAKCIFSMCHSVREILMNEPRLLRIDSPTYILGEQYVCVLFVCVSGVTVYLMTCYSFWLMLLSHFNRVD